MPRRRRPPRPGALADLAPLRILSQIIALQTLYYASAGVLILFAVLVAGEPLRLDLLLSWRRLRGDVTVGWMLGIVWMLNSLIMVISLLLLISRSKLIPDFALTIHFLHLVVTSLYTRSIPTYWFWWALQLASAAVMTALGVWTCQWRELRPINFGAKSESSQDTSGAGKPENARDGLGSSAEDGASGFRMGRGRGRGRDGGGEYEMVRMTPQDEAV